MKGTSHLVLADELLNGDLGLLLEVSELLLVLRCVQLSVPHSLRLLLLQCRLVVLLRKKPHPGTK